MEIIIGTYEQFLLGFKVQKNEKKYNLERSFATHSHISSIRSVTSKKHYLASGGADDTIALYDMRSRTESGKLMHHDGTVTFLEFTPDGSHLISCSGDASIAIVRCGNWQLEKLWKDAHKGSPINALAVHPTGKLAMSVGGDGVLRTWNLIKGRQAYATNLVTRLKYDAKTINVIRWSPSGDKYFVVCNNRLDVYSVETAGLIFEGIFDNKIVSAQFLNDSDDIVVIGHEDGHVRLYNINDKNELFVIKGHEARVKCVECKNDQIVTASSTGEIKLWKFINGRLKQLANANADSRITCMTLI